MSNAARKARKRAGDRIDTTSRTARSEAGATRVPAKLTRAQSATFDALVFGLVTGGIRGRSIPPTSGRSPAGS